MGDRLTVKTGCGREMEGRVGGRDRVLGVAAVWLRYLVEGSDLVALVESHYGLAHCLDVSGDVIALVGRGPVCWPHQRDLPVLGVGARNDHANEDLARFRDGDIGVSDRH